MINPDLPITKASEDKLNRKSFAENLAHVLLQSSFPTSFSVGLYGPWGSGKTSLLNMVVEQVEAQNKDVIVLRFNPWLCSDPKQLITQFFKQLASAIKVKKPAADTMCELVEQYADIFDAAALIPYVGTGIVAFFKAIAAKARRHNQQKNNDLQGKKDEIVSKMREENLKIIVTIDDIDRLSDEEIAAVFQLVKALADFPNAVYLLAFDYKVVVHALSAVQYGDGREYLEKVIQVPFEVPAPSIESIHDALFAKIGEILGDLPASRWDKTKWVELFQYGVKDYIHSMRDVIRYTNTFDLKYQLLREETNPVDLLGLTCLQVFEPGVYSALSHGKDVLCGAMQDYSYSARDAEEKKVKSAMDTIFSIEGIANEQAAKNIAGLLFPKVRRTLGCSLALSGYYDHRKFLIECSIASPECFDRYFSLSLEENAIPSAAIRRLLYETEEAGLEQEIYAIYQDGKIIRLLEEIEAYANKRELHTISATRAAVLICSLCHMWHRFEVEEEGFFAVPFEWRLYYCVDALLEIVEEVDKFPLLQSIFEDQNVAPSTLSMLLQRLEAQHGRFTNEKPDEEDKRTLSLDNLVKLESIFKARCREAIASGAALSQNDGLNFLWLLGQIDDAFTKQIKESLVTDDPSLAKVISYCTAHGKAAATLVVKTYRVDKKLLGEFVDLKEAYDRMCIFVKTYGFLELSEENQRDVGAFFAAMKQTGETDPLLDSITEEEAEAELKRYKF